MEVMGEGIMLIHLRCRCNLDLWNVRYRSTQCIGCLMFNEDILLFICCHCKTHKLVEKNQHDLLPNRPNRYEAHEEIQLLD